MKGGKNVYILIIAVIIVWGLVAYRIVQYVKPEEETKYLAELNNLELESKNFQFDSFTIVANYRDPFLGDMKQPKSSLPRKIFSPVKVSKPLIKVEQPWPFIVFHGLIKNKDSKRTYALLTINGKTKSFSYKDEWQGVKVLAFARDSIILGYNKQKRSFKKK